MLRHAIAPVLNGEAVLEELRAQFEPLGIAPTNAACDFAASQFAARRHITARDLIVTPAYAPQSYRFVEPGRWFNMQFSSAWLARATDAHELRYQRSEIVHSSSAGAWAMRVEQPRTAVATSKRPLSVIAMDAGFADQAHLTRVFKQAFGETPGQYARSLRGH